MRPGLAVLGEAWPIRSSWRGTGPRSPSCPGASARGGPEGARAGASTWTSDSGAVSAGRTWVGVYWERAVLDRARSAYVSDLYSDPDSPGSFEGWLKRALAQHARRTPQQRAELADITIEPDPRRKLSKGYRLAQDVVAAMEEAIVADGQELGRVHSRSGFVHEAVLAAAEDARRRLGHDMPPAPTRLPIRPVRPLTRS